MFPLRRKLNSKLSLRNSFTIEQKIVRLNKQACGFVTALADCFELLQADTQYRGSRRSQLPDEGSGYREQDHQSI